jgi:hypothetical protein
MIRLTVPLPPNIANNPGRTWGGRHHKKKRYFAQLDERQNCGLIPAPPTSALVRVEISATMTLGSKMDAENAKYRAYKWPCDWLKTRGYIANDAPPNCVMRDPEQIIKRDGNPRVEIELTPITESAA